MKLSPLALFFAGLLATAWQFPILSSREGLGRGMETVAIARTLAQEGRFANPFGVETGATAQQAPLYPAILATILKIAGEGTAAGTAIVLLAFLFHALQYPLLPILSDQLFHSRQPGYWACLWLAVIPTMKIYLAWADASLIALAVMAWCAAFHGPAAAQRSVAAGATAGLVLLLHPAAGAVLLPWFVVSIWSSGQRWRKLPLFAAMAAAVCLPWTLRNTAELGDFVPIRDNFGLELQVSNNDLAAPQLLRNQAAQRAFHPNENPSEAARMKSTGELPYFREKGREAWAWIGANTPKFLQLTAARIREFWLPDPALNGSTAWSASLLTLLSAAGLLIRRRSAGWKYALPVLLFFPLPYYLVQADIRYRMPVLWLSLLPAGIVLEHSACRIKVWLFGIRNSFRA
ncbi:MAG: hypothetical protein HY821_09385 [Acidobacteria bacterium]|nr:hypothetical protein [Acidobacteriota bacterium]